MGFGFGAGVGAQVNRQQHGRIYRARRIGPTGRRRAAHTTAAALAATLAGLTLWCLYGLYQPWLQAILHSVFTR